MDDLSDALHNLFLHLNAAIFHVQSVTHSFQQLLIDSPTPLIPHQVKALACANDTLVYLRDVQDFIRLQQAVHVYMKASNSLLNYHKTTPTSLCGKPQLDWQAFLATHDTVLSNGMMDLLPLLSFTPVIPSAPASLNGIWPFKNYMILSAMLPTYIHNVMCPFVDG